MKFKVNIYQRDYFKDSFEIEANSNEQALLRAKEVISNNPINNKKNTFDYMEEEIDIIPIENEE